MTREDILMKLDELKDYLESAVKKTKVTLEENRIALKELTVTNFSEEATPLFKRMSESLEKVNEKQAATLEGYERTLSGLVNLRDLVEKNDLAVDIYNAMLLINGE